MNLPNSDKINNNLKNSLQKRQNINNPIQLRNNNNNALFIKDDSEEEFDSVKEKIRKKYKSPPRENNNVSNTRNIRQKNNEEIKQYEYKPSYQIRNDNIRNSNSNLVRISNSANTNNNMKYNNEFEEIRMMNQKEMKIKEFENKVKFLEEKSFEKKKKLKKI